MNKQIDPGELDFLLRFPVTPNVVSPVDFLSHQCWGGIKALSNMEQFRDLDKDIEVCTYIFSTYSRLWSTSVRLLLQKEWTALWGEPEQACIVFNYLNCVALQS